VRVCAAGRGPATAALRPRGLPPRPLAHVASHDRSGYLARILSDETGQLLTAISSADVRTVRIDGPRERCSTRQIRCRIANDLTVSPCAFDATDAIRALRKLVRCQRCLCDVFALGTEHSGRMMLADPTGRVHVKGIVWRDVGGRCRNASCADAWACARRRTWSPT
jgi:hypothetical protein